MFYNGLLESLTDKADVRKEGSSVVKTDFLKVKRG
jgi:hypothetical protein